MSGKSSRIDVSAKSRPATPGAQAARAKSTDAGPRVRAASDASLRAVIRPTFYNFDESGLVSWMRAVGHGVTAAGTRRLDRLGRATRRAADGGFR
jgi:hypothetical protein